MIINRHDRRRILTRHADQPMSVPAWRYLGAGLSVMALVAVGTVLWGRGQAASYAVGTQAELGTVGGTAVRISDSQASGGQAVRFGSTAPNPNPTPRRLKILPAGDSITYGYSNGAYRRHLYDRLVGTDRLPLDFVGGQQDGPSGFDRDHEGHSGWTIDQINGSIGGWLTTYNPDVVILHIGTNDILRNVDKANMDNRLDRLVGTIFSRKPNVTLVLSTLIPLNAEGGYNRTSWQQYNQAIPGIVSKYKGQGRSVIQANMTGFSNGLPDIRDGVHPSVEGDRKMANVFYPLVRPLFFTPAP